MEFLGTGDLVWIYGIPVLVSRVVEISLDGGLDGFLLLADDGVGSLRGQGGEVITPELLVCLVEWVFLSSEVSWGVLPRLPVLWSLVRVSVPFLGSLLGSVV